MIAVNNAESSCNPKIHSIVTDWRWPLVKLFALSGKKSRDLMSKKFAVESHKSTKLEEFHTIEDRLAKKVTEDSIVMIKMNSKCTLWNGQNHFHRFFNSLQSMYPNSGKIVEWGWSDQICKDSARHGRQCVASFMRFKTCSIKYEKFSNNDKSSLEEFNLRLLRSGVEPFNLDQLSVFLSNVKNYSQTLFALLKKTKPKAILTTCCLSAPEGFAISLAGTKAKVPVVDFQHGQQGPDHSLYCHWPHIPMQGYSSLPSHFWVWGKITANRIEKWGKNRIKVIIGGNPWVQIRTSASQKIDSNLNARKARNSKILVALQSNEIPIQILKIMEVNSQDDVTWCFRPHPIFSSVRKMKTILSKVKSKNWLIDKNEDAFASLIQHDILLTSYSTMAYEALAFGLRVGITSSLGIREMQMFLRKGYFEDASTEYGIFKLINSKHSPKRQREQTKGIQDFLLPKGEVSKKSFNSMWNLSR